MNEFRTVLFIIGLMLGSLAFGMLVPAVTGLFQTSPDWQSFIISACITGFFAVALILTSRGELRPLTVKQAFVLTGFSWLALTAFAALPLNFSLIGLTYTDSFFEAMSGLTTTGATIITGLDTTPPEILLWRAMLQWFGGIGIIVMAISVLPMLNVGGMQLFRLESSDNSEKILPRATEIAGSIAKIYLLISLLCAFAYLIAGMSLFDAITHAMTTISTGGFSTSDNSLGHFNSLGIESVAVFFMIISSLPFVVYLQAIQGNREPLFTDAQIRGFLSLLVTIITTLWLYRMLTQDVSAATALREVIFNTTSLLTGTGYASSDYGQWGNFAICLLFIVLFIGGCAGSTSCGLKVFRVQVVLKSLRRQVQELAYPNGVFVMKYNGNALPDTVTASVLTFAFTYFTLFGLIALVLGMLGLDALTALSAAAAGIANVGPGMGEIIGPQGNYSELPIAAKWVLCLAMLLGRLELFSVLVMLTPRFWRN